MTPARAAGVGAFLVGGFLLFAAVLFTIGERQMLFHRTFTVRAAFASVSGLEPGAPVRLNGMPAGRVTAIDLPPRPSGKFTVTCQVRDDLHRLIRTDSVASIQTEGLVGGTFLALGVGSDQAPAVADDGLVQSREPFAMSDLMQQMSETVRMVNDTIATLRGDVETTVAMLAETTQHADALLEDITDDVERITASGAKLGTDVSAIVAGVRAGHGTVGRLLTDDDLYRRVTTMARDAEATVADARRAVAEGRAALQRVSASGGAADGIVNELRVTLDHTRETMGDMAENAEALKHNFLFRGFFNRRGYFDLAQVPPSAYARGVLEQNGRRKHLQIWLRADRLFEDAGGVERLSADGRTRLDSAMATYLPYLQQAPLVIEGYATTGAAADQYVLSRARAVAVRDYLVTRFSLDRQQVGPMPLGAAAEGSPTGAAFDGVALAVFVERATLED